MPRATREISTSTFARSSLRGAIGLQMQNPASKGGVANPLEWKGDLNDHSGAVLVPATNDDETDQAEDRNRSLAESEGGWRVTPLASPALIITDLPSLNHHGFQ
jgi:hypothetical protein